ncbi:hypothetical protein AJ79_04551 [Helicocarpus griseus UAMH5409]|uniref:Ankyrin repeat protein n=1 Tax=Helicocarpus griseus UAMH5409 TaxID=1447875 RepID=A0A2B7XJQ6_9EURO|nr:hypothetical protein AJ79_04551 [Helicocarpus griseus UAMH5409]
MELPSLPVPLDHFIPYLSKHCRDDVLAGTVLGPFKAYETKLREVFAQEPDSKIIENPHVNVLPIYKGHEEQLKVKARDLEKETPAEAEKYMLPLIPEARKKDGSPAIVPSIEQFKENFRLFSESSLIDMDWNNVVVAGSAVTTCLLPVPDKFNPTRKAQREYYHEKIAPSSDVDLFLYGLDEEQAIEKIKQIEQCIRNSILEEISVIRTKNALTIVSKYPTRHVQIVLRLYKSISEILTGFDVDCACTAFDGSQVWASPRAIAAYVTQANSIDLTRRSPSYENRLAKYAHRGFEVHWPALDRSKLDPTIFERSFNHITGLARLMVMEKLPTQHNRDDYIEQRRQDRDRPPPSGDRHYRNRANMKEVQPEDIAEWVEQEDVSNYHTFTIPYGPKYTAKKIEKLIYKKDLLLNAEWNKPKDRTVDLHRHPAFFGTVEHVVDDCCGFCPIPVMEEDKAVAEEEAKKYISGKIEFIKNDPGRQAIGSFNPITDADWTESAYVGDTESLCQAIVVGDLAHVQKCCSQEGFNVDRRDHTGRTPLHLAIICGTPEIVQCLINHDARLVSRIAGGFTALHLAAARGDVKILRAILRKSEANQVEFLEKSGKKSNNATHGTDSETDEDEEDDDISLVKSGTQSPYAASHGSMVMVDNPKDPEDVVDEDEPNFYEDVGVLSWDKPLSPLHVAILYGHLDIINSLATEFGADPSQPYIQKSRYHWSSPGQVVLSMLLSMHHPFEKSRDVLQALLELGASSTQANMQHVTAFHALVMAGEPRLLDLIFKLDGPAAQLAINHPTLENGWSPHSTLPLITAIRHKGMGTVERLLEHGAALSVPNERLRRFWARKVRSGPIIEQHLRHPFVKAAEFSPPAVIKKLLEAGADPNAMTPDTYKILADTGRSYDYGLSVLDIIVERIAFLKPLTKPVTKPIYVVGTEFESDEVYLNGLVEGTYEHSFVQNELAIAKIAVHVIENASKYNKLAKFEKQQQLKIDWIQQELKELEEVKQALEAKGAKTFAELHPKYKDNVRVRKAKEEPSSENEETEAKKFEIDYSFTDQDVGDVDAKRYLPLFQAAWDGDIQKVKQLTAISEGPKKPHPSLQLTVKHKTRHVDPSCVAVARGHFKLAKAILEDVDSQQIQRDTEKSSRKVYELVVDDDSDTYISNSDSGDSDNGVGVRFDVVDDQHTIDDVRDTVNVGKYTTSPTSLLTGSRDMSIFIGDMDEENKKNVKYEHKRRVDTMFHNWDRTYKTRPEDMKAFTAYRGMTLLEFAVWRNDFETVKFLVEQETYYSTRPAKDTNGSSNDEVHKFITLNNSLLRTAMQKGYTEILGYLMSKTGLGFPFETLMQEAGVKADAKPKYYQGLSVYGKKRKDWAAEDSYGYRNSFTGAHSLLLLAITQKNLQTIKWFLSDEPEKKYREFLHAYKDDTRLVPLLKQEGGFEHMLNSWLGARRHLALHCAVLAAPTEELGNSLVEFILQKLPDSLHSKNSAGLTPLHLAFSGQRITAAKTLVEAGADQTARDNDGRNVLHHILGGGRRILNSPKLLRVLTDILDPEILKTLTTQRTRLHRSTNRYAEWGMRTPLSDWLGNHGTSTAVLETLLDITGGKELYVLDGHGNYPIHQVTKSKKFGHIRAMLERDSDLAILENATGITPLEIAENKLTTHLIDRYRETNTRIFANQDRHMSYYHEKPAIYDPLSQGYRRSDYTFDSTGIYGTDKDKRAVLREECDEGKMAQSLRDAAAKSDRKRILVSLHDANQLVRRLETKGYSIVSFNARKDNDDEDGEDGEDEGGEGKRTEVDEVQMWINQLSDQSYDAKEILKEEKDELEGEDADC